MIRIEKHRKYALSLVFLGKESVRMFLLIMYFIILFKFDNDKIINS